MLYAHWIINTQGQLALSWESDTTQAHHNSGVKQDELADCGCVFIQTSTPTHGDYQKAS